MYPSSLLKYEEVLDRLGKGTAHVLLGNGFSVACDPIFSYGRLYDAAVSAGLSERAQEVFSYLGTNNFEGVMRLLDDANWIAGTYGLLPLGKPSDMLADVEIVKNTLIEAVANSHLPHTGFVDDEKKVAAHQYLNRFQNVFTTNYDLLAYWVAMSANPIVFQDGFREDHEAAPYVVFSERLGRNRGIFYLHGALHLYLAGGELRKHCWSRTHTPLTDLIKAGLSEKNYPLFVAEGSADQKLQQIQRSGYLWYCLDKLARIASPLVIFGQSLGESDQHILDILAKNLDLSTIYLGIYGGNNTPAAQMMWDAAEQLKAGRAEASAKRGRDSDLDVYFYASETASVWSTDAA